MGTFLAVGIVGAAAVWCMTAVWDYCHYDSPWLQSRAVVRRLERAVRCWWQGWR